MEFNWIGQISYSDAEKLQLKTWKDVKGGASSVVYGLEHPAVITLGARAQDQDLIATRQGLQQMGVQICRADRGGQATLHSEGQLVIYPIVNLKLLGLSVKELVLLLETVTIQTLQHFGIQSFRQENIPGVFTTIGKIGFCGLRIQDGISRHGISVNIANDLEMFSLIRSCGVCQSPLDRVANYNPEIGPRDFYEVWVQKFTEK